MALAVLDQNCAKLLIFVGCFKIGAVSGTSTLQVRLRRTAQADQRQERLTKADKARQVLM